METPVVLRLSRGAAVSVAAGHPWVYREDARAVPCGTPVTLVDGRDRPLGWGVADEGSIAVRVLGHGAPRPLPRLLAERVHRADTARVRLVGPDTDAYRVVSGPGDGVPGLVVDRYGALAVLRIYSHAWQVHLRAVVDAVAALPWVTTVARRLGVTRVDGQSGLTVLSGPEPSVSLVVTERGVRHIVRPHTGQKTGMFLDQRVHRRLVGEWAAGRTVLNLFAYTGGFSVCAALGGAARVTTVDLAPEAIADARENFRLNGLDPVHHGFEVADAFHFTPPDRPDLWVVDPPSLARRQRSEGAARTAYRRLHARLAPLVPRDGLLASSSCTARMSAEEWALAVESGLASAGAWSWHWRSGAPPDHPVAVGHPEGHYLKFGLLRRRG